MAQMQESEKIRAKRRESKERDLAYVMQQQKLDEELEKQMAEVKLENQAKIRDELTDFVHFQSQIEQMRKEKEAYETQQFLNNEKIKEEAAKQEQMRKKIEQKKLWEVVNKANEEQQFKKKIEKEKEIENDRHLMEEYAQRLEIEDRRRKQFLGSLNKRINANESEALRIAEQQKRQQQKELEAYLEAQQVSTFFCIFFYCVHFTLLSFLVGYKVIQKKQCMCILQHVRNFYNTAKKPPQT